MRYDDEKKETHQKWAEKSSTMRIRQSWRNLMDSTKKKMSRGAQFITRMIPWARNENWRGSAGHSPEKKGSGHKPDRK